MFVIGGLSAQDSLLNLKVEFFLVVYLCEWAWFLLTWYEDISVMLLLLLLVDMDRFMFWGYLWIVSGYSFLMLVCGGMSICLFWPRPVRGSGGIFSLFGAFSVSVFLFSFYVCVIYFLVC